MALANVAWILASNGKRVLVIDWDLEAPGLHRYFHPFLADKELSQTEGLIDFFVDFAVAAATPLPNSSRDRDWYERNANILRYAISLDYDFPDGGFIDFVPAGKQGIAYSTRVNSFNWDGFYERMGGGVFIESFKEQARRAYQYILIDSRTGVSDTSGICTVQLPDVLVVCFTLNTQGIVGSAAVAKSALEGSQARPDLSARKAELRILPVPMRIENAEYKKLERQLARARAAFSALPSQLLPLALDQYWGRVQFPYVSFYAYEEILATVGDRAGDPKLFLAAAERLTGYITEGVVQELPPMDEVERHALLARFEEQPAPPPPAPPADGVPQPTPAPRPVARQWSVPVAAAPTAGQPAARGSNLLRWAVGAVGLALVLLLVASILVLRQATNAIQIVTATETAPTSAPANVAQSAIVPTEVPTAQAPLAPAQTPTPVSTSAPVATAAGKAAPTPTPAPTVTWRQEASLIGHTNGGVWSAQFSPDSSTVVTGSGDGTARLWDVNAHQPLGGPLQHGADGVWSAAFSPDGKLVATASNDGTAQLWDVATRQRFGNLMRGQDGPMYQAAFSPDGTMIVTAHDGGTIQLWDVASQQRIGVPLAGAVGGTTMAPLNLTPLGNVRAGTFIFARPSGGQVWSAAFSYDGKLIVSGHNDGAARLWDVATRSMIGVFQGHTKPVISVAFSRDSKLVVTSSGDGTARLWNVDSQQPIDPQLGPGAERRIDGQVWSAAFTPDGKTVVTASSDSAVRLWDTASHTLTTELPGLTGEVHDAQFNRDQDRMVTSSSDGTVLLWTSRVSATSAAQSGPGAGSVTPSATPTPGTVASRTPVPDPPTPTPTPTPTGVL